MGGKKKTKQDEIHELHLKNAALTKELADSNFRKAELAEEKHHLKEKVEFLEKKYEKVFEELAVLKMEYSSCSAAFSHWYKVATTAQKEIIRRGSRRAQHDPEFAIIRELLHTHDGKLSADQVIAMANQHPNADLRRMVSVADEFGLKLKFDIASKELKKGDLKGIPFDVGIWTYEGGTEDGKKYKATMKVNEAFVATEKQDGDSKD